MTALRTAGRHDSRNKRLAVGLIALVTFAAVFGLSWIGAFQGAELAAYDYGLRWRAAEDSPPDSRVSIIGITEEDIREYRWPLSDELLARAITRLADLGATAIGIDIYRDFPVPPGESQLSKALTENKQVVWVFKFSNDQGQTVPLPAVLRGGEQGGFNDLVLDSDGTVRRGLLFTDDGTRIFTSFPLRLATNFLDRLGAGIAADGTNPEYIRIGRVTIPPIDGSEGGYAHLDARGYQFMLDFRQMHTRIPQISMRDLLAGRVDAEQIRGRAVLIGVVAASVNDYFVTPKNTAFDSATTMRGVELQSRIVGQLLRMAIDGEPATVALKAGSKALWLCLWAVLGVSLVLLLRSMVWLVAASLLGVLLLLAGFLTALNLGWWLPLAAPAAAFWLAGSSATVYLAFSEKRDRAVLMQLFSRHVSKDVAQAVWLGRDRFFKDGKLKPENLRATILFTDLRNFTVISEDMPPDELMTWLNEYMETMARIVMDHDGVIDKFIGDAIMAVFGIPIPRETDEEFERDASNAVACALAMEQALVALNDSRSIHGEGQELGMRVGIHSGPIVAGSLGSAERMDYTVIGDTVNTASRLESFDKTVAVDGSPCRILVSKATLDLLRGAYTHQWVGDVELKGKSRSTAVYRILGARRTAEIAPRAQQTDRTEKD